MVQGRGIDASLNELGRRQSEAFFKAYKRVDFDKIYVSSLKRTQESVQGFIDMEIPFEKLSGLDEISWGNHEGQSFDPEMHKRYTDCIDDWQMGKLDSAVGGGESPNQVMTRQGEAMDYILSKDDEETILICMHGRAMRILICWLLDYDLTEMEQFEHENLCLYELDYDGDSYELIRANDTDHMANLS